MKMNLKYYLRGLGVGFIVCALILGIHHFRKNDSVMTDDQIRARAEQLGMVEASSRLTDNDVPDAEELLQSIDEPAPPEKEEISAEPEEDITAEPEQEDIDTESTDDVTDVPMDDVTSEISQEVADDPDAVSVNTETLDSAENTDQTAGNDDAAGSASEQSTGNDADTPDSATDTSSESEGNTAAADNSTAASDTGSVNPVGGQITIVSGDSSYRVAQKLEDAGIIPSASAYDLYLCNNGYDRYIRTGSFSIPAGSSDQDIAKLITGR